MADNGVQKISGADLIKPFPEEDLTNFLLLFGHRVNTDEPAAELCKRDFYFFLKEFWNEVIPSPFIDAPHIRVLCYEAQRVFVNVINKKPAIDLLVNLPPGSSKSAIFSILFPAYCLAVLPSFRIISVSYTSTLAIDLATKCRSVIQSAKYRRYFPFTQLKDDESGKQNYRTTLGGGRFSSSIDSSVIGFHADLIIGDDLIDALNVKIKGEREKSNDFLYSVASTRVTDKVISAKITVQQRLHYNDNTAHILEKQPNIKHICLPSELSEKVKPAALKSIYQNGLLDPIRGSWAALEKARIDLGEYQYKVQFKQDPDDEENAKIKRAWFKVITPEEFAAIAGNDKKINFYVDTAFTDNDIDNDPTVAIATCTVNNMLYITGLLKGFWEFPDMVKQIIDFVHRNGYTTRSKIFIEQKASGISTLQQLKKTTNLNVHPQPKMKGSKEEKLSGVSGMFEALRVVLIDASWNTKLLDEITAVVKKYWDITDCVVAATQFEILTGSKPVTADRFS